jgi:hypothetical protein
MKRLFGGQPKPFNATTGCYYGEPVEASFAKHVLDALTSPFPKRVY